MDKQKKLSGERMSYLKGKFRKFLSDGRTKAESEDVFTTNLHSEERGNGGSSPARLLEEILLSRSSSSSSSSDSVDGRGSELSTETKTEKNNSDSSPFSSEKRKNGPGSTGSSRSSNDKNSKRKTTTGESKKTNLSGEVEEGTSIRKDDREKRPVSKKEIRKQFSWFLEEQKRKRGEQEEVEAEGEESSLSSPPKSSAARSYVVEYPPQNYFSHPASPANLTHNVNLHFRSGDSSPVSLVHSISANQPEILRDLSQVSEISVESPVSFSSLDYELPRPSRYKYPTSPANLSHNLNLHYRRGDSSPVSLVHSISANQPEILRDLSQESEISVESPTSSGSFEYERQRPRKNNYPHPANLADNFNLNYRRGESSPVSLVHSISAGESDELRDLGQVSETSVASPASFGNLDRKSLSSIQRSQSTPADYDRTNHPHRHEGGGGTGDETAERTGSQENLGLADLRPRARLSRAESDQVGDEDFDYPTSSNAIPQEDVGPLGVSEPVEEAESEGEQSDESTFEGKRQGILSSPISPGSSTTLSSDAAPGEDSSPDASSSDDEHAEVSSEKSSARKSAQDLDEGGGDAVREDSRELEPHRSHSNSPSGEDDTQEEVQDQNPLPDKQDKDLEEREAHLGEEGEAEDQIPPRDRQDQESPEVGEEAGNQTSRELESRRSDTTSQAGENKREESGQDPNAPLDRHDEDVSELKEDNTQEEVEDQIPTPDRVERESPPDREDDSVTPAIESEAESAAPSEAAPDDKSPPGEPETPPDLPPVDDTDSSMKDKMKSSKSKAREDEATRAEDAPGKGESSHSSSSDDSHEPKSDFRSKSKPEPGKEPESQSKPEPESKPQPKLQKVPSATPAEEEKDEEVNHPNGNGAGQNGNGAGQNDKNEDGYGKKEPIVVTPIAVVSKGGLPTEVQAADGDTLSSIQRHWEDIVKKDPAIVAPSTNTSEIEPDETPPREQRQEEITRHPERHGGPHEAFRDPHGPSQEPSTSTRSDRVYGFPTIVREQDTHDMICPVCHSNVTKRIILRKRKRIIHDERGPKVPEEQPVIEQEPTPDDVAPKPEEPYEVWGCFECFNYFVRLFRREPKQPVTSQEPPGADTGWLPRLCPPFEWGPPIDHPDVVVPQDTEPDVVQERPTVSESKPREFLPEAPDGVQPPPKDSSEATAPPSGLWRQGSSWGDKAPNYQVPPELYQSSPNQYHKQPWKPKPPPIDSVAESSQSTAPPSGLWRQGSSWGDKAPNYQVPPKVYESSQNQYQKQPWKPKPPPIDSVADSSQSTAPPSGLWRQGSSWGDKAPNYQVPPDVYESSQNQYQKQPGKPKPPRKGKEQVVEDREPQQSAVPTEQQSASSGYVHGLEKDYYCCGCVPITVLKKEWWLPQAPAQDVLQQPLIPPGGLTRDIESLEPREQLTLPDQPGLAIASQTRPEEKPLEILKPMVHGGLDVSLVSIGLISSGVGADAKTITIVAMGIANVIYGVIKYFSAILSLYTDTPRQFEEEVGNRYQLSTFIAIVSYLFYGALAPVTYGYTFQHTTHREFKLFATCAVALVAIIYLGAAKAHVQRRSAVKIVSTLIVTVLAAGAAAYEGGFYVRKILEALGFDSV